MRSSLPHQHFHDSSFECHLHQLCSMRWFQKAVLVTPRQRRIEETSQKQCSVVLLIRVNVASFLITLYDSMLTLICQTRGPMGGHSSLSLSLFLSNSHVIRSFLLPTETLGPYSKGLRAAVRLFHAHPRPSPSRDRMSTFVSLVRLCAAVPGRR
ncbi:hypothetical protein M406DRAFT_357669 [Cryphonectria parasitica EP155]|uniref:Uncharacterized protein n=1 Tax=Cryphonectria parasitica (strain ATCC 38755 / EP155) TaxID=660469 RepID=A0A9P5CJI2_CRYP1|nr:uncharacterized protein M406DRAFT_357669 [Cryphonectria parasitica EP155]KAF3761284.1 hypothetical protein M406DRAFT_357669 [Cryphonectria parasitica EP155]